MPASDDKNQEELAYLRAEVKRLRSTVHRLTPDLETLLARRRFTIFKKEPSDDLLLPAPGSLNRYYAFLRKYSFRLFLRDVIKYQKGFTLEQVARYATPEVTARYIAYLLSLRLLKQDSDQFVLFRPIRSFGPTLEWYIAELFRREFGMQAVWGVKFKRPKVGGDYDVVAKFEASLFYVEVKSSPPKQIYDSEIAAFLDRVEDLSPEIAVFFMDTELRMKDKIVPLFEQELRKRRAMPPEVLRMERELFEIDGRTFIVNAKEDIVYNLRKVFYRYYRASGRWRRPGEAPTGEAVKD